MTEVYTPGELRLIYDLVEEFPTRLSVENVSATPNKMKLHVKDPELLGFVEYLVERLRLARNYLNSTTNNTYEIVNESDPFYGCDSHVS